MVLRTYERSDGKRFTRLLFLNVFGTRWHSNQLSNGDCSTYPDFDRDAFHERRCCGDRLVADFEGIAAQT
jgi:hypothetical protein